MNILNYSNGADTGGVSHLLYEAHRKFSDHSYHSLVRSSNYLQYPRHMPISNQTNAFNAADVIHVNNNFRFVERVSRPMVIHYHGTPFRVNPEPFLADQRTRGTVGVVATVDLLLPAPDELTWIPAPADIPWLESYRKPQDGPLRIGHAPTDRAIKSTEALIAAVRRLKKSHPVELVLVEHKTWEQCLNIKGTMDVYFDQVILGYGMNAIEAWGMGIPVIAGAQPDTLTEMRNQFGDLPFYEATEATIYAALAELVDPTTRAEWGAKGRAHVERFHSEAEVVARLAPIYAQAYALGPAAPLDRAGLPGGRVRGPRRHGRR